jgi:FkbM family methyltransferase
MALKKPPEGGWMLSFCSRLRLGSRCCQALKWARRGWQRGVALGFHFDGGAPVFLGQRLTTTIIRPYIWFELPAWGRIYQTFVGDYKRDFLWSGSAPRWTRGKLHGYEMLLDLGQWSNRMTFFLGRLYDLPSQLLLKQTLKDGDTFIDIGANEGMLSLVASRLVGPRGKVVAFEPNPEPRDIFQKTIHRNAISNITIVPIGLSDKDDTLMLSSPKINSGEASFGRSNYSTDDIDVVKCVVRRGDDILAGETPKLIKIDVEGFELHVLQGLEKLLASQHPTVVMEMIAGHLANADTKPEDIVSLMIDLGYEPFQIGLKRSGFRYELTVFPTFVGPDINDDILWVHPDH